VIFLADEGVEKQIVTALRSEGHVVTYVAEMDPGVADDVVLEWANKEKALLLTSDKNFGEMVFRQRRLSAGVILVRLSGLPPLKKAEAVLNLIRRHSQELVEAFSVVTPAGTRIRPKRS
jgi:predicted nuclease of predicted toxin-antitoxin system